MRKKLPHSNPAFGVILFSLCLFASLLCAASPVFALEDIYEARLDQGLLNTEPYSYLLIEMAHNDRSRAKEYLGMARRYAPDLPAVYFELAREELSPSAQSLFQWLDYFRQGIRAYGRSFRWEFSLAGLLYMSLFVSFGLSLLLIIGIRLPMETGLILHEGREDRKRLALLALPVLLALLGPIAFIAGALFVVGLYHKKESKAVVYISIIFFLLSPTLSGLAHTFLMDSPALRAIAEVNERRDNRYALRTLKGRSDFLSTFSYALALKREGGYPEAIKAYESLIDPPRKPDPRVYVNLGNSYYALREIDTAKDFYRKATEIMPLPSAFYNLSQVHRETLDFARGDEYFLEAAKLNSRQVSKFASLAADSPNRFVADETLPTSVIWKQAMAGVSLLGGDGSASAFRLIILILAVVLTAGFYLIGKKIKYRALRCKKCGEIFCSRCSRAITWGEMCPRCYLSLIKIDEIDSKERIKRLLSIYQSQTRRRKTARVLSCAVPGAGQIYAGKLLAGLFLLWPFLFSLTLLVLNMFGAMGPFPFDHGWTSPIAMITLVVTYTVSVFHMKRRINRGWL